MINIWTKGTQYSHRPIGRSDDMDSADRSLFKLAQVYYSGGSRAKEKIFQIQFACKDVTIFQTVFSPVSCSPVAPIIAPIGHYLFVALTPEQIIMTYLPCHLTYQSACVNTGLGLRLKKGFRVTAQPHLCHDRS